MERTYNLQTYFDLVGHDSIKAREVILKLPFKDNPYLLSCIALTYKDEAIFFKNGNKRKEFLMEKLIIAKSYIDKATLLNPHCRDILYIKGEIYEAIGNRLEAIDCFINIIENNEKLNPIYNCSESDLSYIKMIVNDAHYQLYLLFKETAPKLAYKFLKRYKSELHNGVKTIY